MTGAKFDIEKFNGTGDFGLWRIKMRALLIQHGCEAGGSERSYRGDDCSGGLVKARDFVHDKVIVQQVVPEEDVMATLNSKEIKERSKVKGDDGEGLYVRGRTGRRDSRQSNGKS
ncbi:hypothetical protein Tco_1011268 [Tanacetum coccineum]